jgi:hypothetical protein
MTYLGMQFIAPTTNPDSAINVYGDALKSQDPATMGAAFAKLLTSLDLTCGWQVRQPRHSAAHSATRSHSVAVHRLLGQML